MKKIPDNAEKVFQGVIFDVYQWQQKMFDGSYRTFEFLKRKHAAVAFCVFEDKTILINEEEQPGKPSFISLPGGGADAYDEEPLDVIKRELKEETGYVASSWKEVHMETNFPKVDWTIHYFVAKDLKKVGTPQNDASEKITSKRISFDEFLNLHRNHKFRDKGLAYLMLRAQTDEMYRAQIEKKLFD